jgi:hypothetical protein
MKSKSNPEFTDGRKKYPLSAYRIYRASPDKQSREGKSNERNTVGRIPA